MKSPSSTQNNGKHVPEPAFQEYLGTVWRGRWIILITFVVVLAAVVAYTKSLDKVYKATATILVNTHFAQSSLFMSGMLGDERNIVQNELEVLRSRPLAERVMKKLVDRKWVDTVRHTPIKIIQRTMSGDSAGGLAVGPVITARLMGSVDLEPMPGTDVIAITARSGDQQEVALIADMYAEAAYEQNLFTSRAKSRSIREFLENQVADKKRSLDQAEDSLKQYMQAHNIVSLDQETSSLVNQLSNLEAQRDAAEVTLQSLGQTLKSYQGQFSEQESNVSKVMGAANDPYITLLQEQLAKLEVQRDVTIAQNPSSAGKTIYTTQLKQIDDQIVSLRSKLQARTDEFLKTLIPGGQTSSGQQDPASYLKQVKQKMIETEIDIQATRAKKKALEDAIAGYDRQFNQVPARSVELAQLQRTKQSAERLYTAVLEKFNEANINEQSQFGYIELIDRATIPVRPSSPKTFLNILMGAVLGLGLGIVGVIVKERLDLRVQSPDDVKREGLDLMGTVMRMNHELKHLDKSQKEGPGADGLDPHLIAISSPLSGCTESYRHLRTNLRYSKRDNPLQMALVTSTKPSEGKSTTVGNLAIVFAQTGTRVLLVDADLRKPALAANFKLANEPGLADFLSGNAPFEGLAQKTSVENLELVPGGKAVPNPSELLGSDKMKEFLAAAKESFGLVFIDSSPILAGTDSTILATMVDTVIVVTSSGETRINELRDSVEALKEVSGKVPVVVLNNFNLFRAYGIPYGRSAYGHYRSYYKAEKK